MAGKIDNIFGASRWMLPEHIEALHMYGYEKTLVKKPELADDELAEMNYRIHGSLRYDYAVTVRWWNRVKGDLGEIITMWGVVKTIDAVHRWIKVVNDEESAWIEIDDITDVRA